MEIENCTFTENVSLEGNGGALAITNVHSREKKFNMVLKDNVFIRNSAVDGGGVSISEISFFE